MPQTVRNYMFATIDHKASVVLDAEPRFRAEPLDNTSTLEMRQHAAQATQHDMERCMWQDIREDCYITASVNKLGVAMIRMETDKLSGERKVAWDVIDIRRFYPDPSATRLYKAGYVFYEPEMSLADIRERWPEKCHLIKPKKTQPSGSLEIQDNGKARTDAEILAAPGQEIAVSDDGKVSQRVADVAYLWIKQDEVFEDTRKVVSRAAMVASECQDCMLRFESGLTDTCPSCGGTNIAQVEVPEDSQEYTVMTRKYPFGRLIITCQDVLLYDGPPEIELDDIFPFEAFALYRDPRSLHGFDDMQLLRSNQMQADKNASRLFQAMAVTGQGFFEFPAGELGYQHATNEMGQKIPVKPENAGKARWVNAQGYNVQLHSVADNSIFSDFQRISGETDQAVSQMPSAPDSATEVKSRDSVRQSRMGRIMKRVNRFSSGMATKHYQAMNQYYVGPRPFMFSQNGSEFESIVLDVSMLPRNLHIKVEADIDGIERDKLAGQNLVAAMQAGIIPMMPDLFLRAIGTPEAVIQEVMQRPEMQMHMQMMALAAIQGGAAQPNGNAPNPQSGNNANTQRAPNKRGVN